MPTLPVERHQTSRLMSAFAEEGASRGSPQEGREWVSVPPPLNLCDELDRITNIVTATSSTTTTPPPPFLGKQSDHPTRNSLRL